MFSPTVCATKFKLRWVTLGPPSVPQRHYIAAGSSKTQTTARLIKKDCSFSGKIPFFMKQLCWQTTNLSQVFLPVERTASGTVCQCAFLCTDMCWHIQVPNNISSLFSSSLFVLLLVYYFLLFPSSLVLFPLPIRDPPISFLPFSLVTWFLVSEHRH